MFISPTVIGEISEGDESEKEKRSKFIDTLIADGEITVLDITSEIADLAVLYFQKLNLPPNVTELRKSRA